MSPQLPARDREVSSSYITSNPRISILEPSSPDIVVFLVDGKVDEILPGQLIFDFVSKYQSRITCTNTNNSQFSGLEKWLLIDLDHMWLCMAVDASQGFHISTHIRGRLLSRNTETQESRGFNGIQMRWI